MNTTLLSMVTNMVSTYTTISLNELPAAYQGAWKSQLEVLPTCTPSGPWIAGGAVRRFFKTPSSGNIYEADVDYFVGNDTQRRLLESFVEMQGATKIRENQHHKTYRWKQEKTGGMITLQIIHTRMLPSLKEHLEHFDFTICQMGWDGEDFLLSAAGALDLQRSRLEPTGFLVQPTGSLMRIPKYVAQGFECPMSTYEAIVNAINTNAEKGDPDGSTHERLSG